MDSEQDQKSANEQIIELVASELDADILLYNGALERHLDQRIMNLYRERTARKNVLLILVTDGGDPDVAYRIGKFLQSKYECFTVFVSGYCKSAGTLVAIGAHAIIMGEAGELGPLDVQLKKPDTLWEQQSGLTAPSALSELRDQAFKMYEHYLLEVSRRSGGRITVKTASESAIGIVSAILGPISEQIDPMHIGEASRINNLGYYYGMRLDLEVQNLRDGALEYLVESYPTHGFVIDFEEARTLFERVFPANEMLIKLADKLENLALWPISKPGEYKVKFLNEATPEKAEGKNDADENQKDNTESGEENENAKRSGEEVKGDLEHSGVPTSEEAR